MKRTRLQNVRKETIEEIKSILSEHNMTELSISDIDYGDSPLVFWGEEDENTFTLDSIKINPDGHLTFDSSSSWNNRTDCEETMPTDALVDIVEFLIDHNREMKDLQMELQEDTIESDDDRDEQPWDFGKHFD